MLEQRMQGSFKRRLLIAVFLGVSAAASFAQTSAKSYLSFLSAADLGKLEANGSLTGFGVKLQDLGIWKVTPFADSSGRQSGNRQQHRHRESVPRRPARCVVQGRAGREGVSGLHGLRGDERPPRRHWSRRKEWRLSSWTRIASTRSQASRLCPTRWRRARRAMPSIRSTRKKSSSRTSIRDLPSTWRTDYMKSPS